MAPLDPPLLLVFVPPPLLPLEPPLVLPLLLPKPPLPLVLPLPPLVLLPPPELPLLPVLLIGASTPVALSPEMPESTAVSENAPGSELPAAHAAKTGKARRRETREIPNFGLRMAGSLPLTCFRTTHQRPFFLRENKD
jgi:hypothetical protein